MASSTTKQIKKILIVRLGAIGDVVHTTNTYRSIKQKYPNIEIHYLTTPLISPLLENDIDLTSVWTITPKEIKPFSKECKNYADKIKNENFDLVINLQPSFKTKWLLLLSGIKRKLNYKKTFKLHAVTNFWQIAKKELNDIPELPNLKLFLNENVCKMNIKKINNCQKPFIVFNAGGVFSKRQGRTYPINKWMELGNKIQEKYNGTIFITGSKEDEKILAPLQNIQNSKFYVGKISLEETSALFKECDLLISGDSGPLHIATSLDTKTIGLYGSMPISRTGPYGEGHKTITSDLPCVPCNRRKCKYLKHSKNIYTPCMQEIKVDEILNNTEQILSKEIYKK